MSTKRYRNRSESGQALVEYFVLFPIAVTLLVMSSGIVSWMNGAYSKTLDGFEAPEFCEVEEPEENSAPTLSEMGNHTIELVSVNYDPGKDETTVVYRVISGPKPSISHWVLGLPPGVAKHIIDESEKYEWTDSDPGTGVAGIKFDKGYETASITPERDETFAYDPYGGSIVMTSLSMPRMAQEQEGEQTTIETGVLTDGRDIAILLSGEFEFQTTTVSIKAGKDIYVDEISAPVAPAPETTENTTEEGCQ